MRHKNAGFTLVEILIVVIILGILAAIVIPQFTEASNDARNNALASDLQTMRGQIELYHIQHLDTYPTAAIVNQLVYRSNSSGTTGSDPNDYPFGPYLQKFPSNPFVAGTTTNQVETGTGTPGSGNYGWYYNTATGKISPDDDDHTSL